MFTLKRRLLTHMRRMHILSVFVNTRAEIVERDLLVAYPVIDIRAIRYAVRISYASDQMGGRITDILQYLI